MSKADQLVAGADALRDLIKRIGEKGEADLNDDPVDLDDIVDTRDYLAMAAMIDESIQLNLIGAGAERREGFLRALTDLFSIIADGCAPSDGWDPLGSTHSAFTVPLVVRAAIDAARVRPL